MDEDEMEMLSEARARLANTRAKKAKRKAREKQLEEARRLASLLNSRQLKAAWLDNRHKKRKRNTIDYNAGFYDVADETETSVVEQRKFSTTIEDLEGERRLRKQDVSSNKIVQRQDAPSAILQADKINDRKRPKMNLSTPQIPDYEAKFGLPALTKELSEGSCATSHGMTPLRTPAAWKQDAIMMEPENQTTLLGGENPDLHPSDFSPKKMEIQTPSVMSTPVTPKIGMTPIKDELHSNEEMEMRDSAAKLKVIMQIYNISLFVISIFLNIFRYYKRRE